MDSPLEMCRKNRSAAYQNQAQGKTFEIVAPSTPMCESPPKAVFEVAPEKVQQTFDVPGQRSTRAKPRGCTKPFDAAEADRVECMDVGHAEKQVLLRHYAKRWWILSNFMLGTFAIEVAWGYLFTMAQQLRGAKQLSLKEQHRLVRRVIEAQALRVTRILRLSNMNIRLWLWYHRIPFSEVNPRLLFVYPTRRVRPTLVVPELYRLTPTSDDVTIS